MKRLKKNWKVALALTVIIAVANLPLQYLAYRFFYVEPFIASFPYWLRPFVEYESFFHTWFGASTITVWVLLIVLWLGYLCFKRRITATPQKLTKVN
jgi:hypothetical protein